MDGLAFAVVQLAFYLQQEVQVFGHDGIGVNMYHGVIGREGVQQLMLYHLSDGGEDNVRCVGATVRGVEIPYHGTKDLAEAFLHIKRDVGEAR